MVCAMLSTRTGAVARNPVVELLVLEIVEDLLASRLLVEFPVRLGLELVADRRFGGENELLLTCVFRRTTWSQT